MQPVKIFSFSDCKTHGYRGSLRLEVFDNTYVGYLYPHNTTTRVVVKLDGLECLDDSEQTEFSLVKNYLSNRIFH